VDSVKDRFAADGADPSGKMPKPARINARGEGDFAQRLAMQLADPNAIGAAFAAAARGL